MALIASVKEKVAEVRQRRPFIDHVVRMVEHYGNVNGSALAAAVTYFAFLSFFPILALSFAVIGLVSKAYPKADEALVTAINGVLPNIIGGPDGLQLETFQENAPGILSVGLLLAVYSGLGWLSGMRTALVAVFEEPEREQPSFVVGKVRDLLALLTLGSVLIVSVGVSGVATKIATPILELVGLGVGAKPLLWAFALVLGLASSALLFFAFFKLLASPNVPTRSLWSGALLGAVAFELLKQLSTVLLQATREQPAVQAFGIALILVVWINYFSRVVVYAAAWAHTSPAARAAREASLVAEQTVEGPQIDLVAAARGVRASGAASSSLAPSSLASPSSPKAAFAAGAASTLGLVALLRRRRR
ncbi:MAG TPA: YhjD/YihY/BrkB family envelope integrity protein [Nocardioides sp.]|nr:YhjD/YihY/BrkB family envelope integrity protein [Nocardioides sp.]